MPPRPRTSRPSKPKENRGESPAASASDPEFAVHIHEIDKIFEAAGLTRNRSKKPAGVVRRARLHDKTPDELRPAPAIVTVAQNGVEWVAVPAWKKFSWLWHGFSTRRTGLSRAYAPDGAPGDLNLGFTASDDRANVLRNRELLSEAITGDARAPLVTLKQIHSSVIHIAGPDAAGTVCKGDGMMTNRPGMLLGVQTADCTPVLVADSKRKVVAAFHAGWRGTAKRIVESGIGRMRLEFGSRPEDLIAAIGPGIGPCCYEVGEDVLSEFESQFSYARELFHEVYDTDPVRTKYPMLFLTQRAPGHSNLGPSMHLDVAEANRRQLIAAGIAPRAIKMVGGCTSCQPKLFFSYRGSRGHCGRMLSVIGIRPD